MAKMDRKDDMFEPYDTQCPIGECTVLNGECTICGTQYLSSMDGQNEPKRTYMECV